MIKENQPRVIMILIGVCVLGCAPSVGRFEPPVSYDHPIPDLGCPYANVFVAVSTSGSKKDTRVANRVQLAYSEFLGEQGFRVVAAPEEAYWSAFSLVNLGPRIDSTFAWTVYVMATQDLEGRIQAPVNFSSEGEGASELSGFMILREVRLLELELQARQAAVDTAGALLPHASRMCVAWKTKPKDEVAPRTEGIVRLERQKDDPIERLREELKAEIMRVRRQRTEKLQRKRLEIEAEELSGL